jgi:hypothetical protein
MTTQTVEATTGRKRLNAAMRTLRKAGYRTQMGYAENAGPDNADTDKWVGASAGQTRIAFTERIWKQRYVTGEIENPLYLSWTGDPHLIIATLRDAGLSVEWDESRGKGAAIGVLPTVSAS